MLRKNENVNPRELSLLTLPLEACEIYLRIYPGTYITTNSHEKHHSRSLFNSYQNKYLYIDKYLAIGKNLTRILS